MSGTNAIAPTINFTQIPSNLQVPGEYMEVAADYSGEGALPIPARALLIGQMLSGAGPTAVPGQIYTIYREDQGDSLFGAGSQLAVQVEAFLLANPFGPVDAVGLAPQAGYLAATGQILITGAPTQAGPLAFGVGGTRIVVNVGLTDTPTTIAAMLAAADNSPALPDLPAKLTTNATAGEVVLTSVNRGGCGNEIDVRVNPLTSDMIPPGLTVAITAMAGGVGIPDISSVLTAIAGTWYTDLQSAFLDTNSIIELSNFAAQQFGPLAKKDVVFYGAMRATPAQFATAMAAASWNSGFGSIMPAQNAQQPSWVWGATICGVAMARSINDPARQFRGAILPGIIPPASPDLFTETTKQALVTTGGAIFDVLPGGVVVIERLVTGYQLSSLGVPDEAYMDVMTAKVITRVRYDWNGYVSQLYSGNKLANDNSLAAAYDNNIVTARRMWNSWAARCTLYEQLGWLEDTKDSVAKSSFVRDPNNRNRLNGQQYIQVIGNLMILAGQLLFEANQ